MGLRMRERERRMSEEGKQECRKRWGYGGEEGNDKWKGGGGNVGRSVGVTETQLTRSVQQGGVEEFN